MTRRWYVVRTKPNSDKLAASTLEREGLETFSPHVDTPVEGNQRKRISLFPGYLFLNCDVLEEARPEVSRLPGVLGWVRFGSEVPHVSDEDIHELKRRVDALDSQGGLWEKFESGQMVKVSHGNIEGLATVLESPRSPESRVNVLLEFMGRQVRAQVPWLSLSSVPEDQGEARPDRRRRRTRGRGRWINGFGPRASAQT
jgi:transcription antitermination factor NusG